MNKKKLLIAISLIVFGTLTRLLLTDLPNVETITITALLAGSLLGGGYAIVIALTVTALTDMYLGNDSILIFTWSAFALIGLAGVVLKKTKKNNPKYIAGMTGLGVLASLLFFFYTNFGVWLLWPGMYARTFQGLIQCYVMGLPFLKYNLIGNLIIIPIVTSTVVYVPQWVRMKITKEKKLES
ncbi:LPXTG cell wall anchor domain-containing protein [Candidatus Falkowbacteria bacterium]|nr:LPXTG cell wall anchor domain-containing protein [Candidatus Falkowbacteria bacterium]